MSDALYDVLLVGGGVVGSSIAYFLSACEEARGMEIGVVEPDPSYRRSSTALSVGGIRQQFSTPENILLSSYSAAFFRDAHRHLSVDGEGPSLDFREAGYLFLATPAGVPVLHRNHSIQTSLGARVEILNPEQLRDRFPWLEAADLAAGSLGIEGEGWLDPHSLLQGFKRKARAQGVTYLRDEVVGISAAGTRILSATLKEAGQVALGGLVNAAGPRAAEIAGMAGIGDLPVRPRKRIVYRIRSREALPGCPMVIDSSGVYFRPEGDGFLCGVSPSPDRDPDTLDLEVEEDPFYDVVWPTLARRVPAFQALRLGSSWAGHYAYNTQDQNAILGPHPEIQNFFFANGFSGHGLQHAAGVGRALAEQIIHGEYRTLDLSRFGFHRFATGALVREENVV